MDSAVTAPRFIADVHLGKLARQLRLLGFDVLYKNDGQKKELTGIAASEGRVLLSRNPAFQKAEIPFQQILSERPEVQLAEVVHHYSLPKWFTPLTRCLLCNGWLAEVAKENVRGKNTRTNRQMVQSILAMYRLQTGILERSALQPNPAIN